MLVGNSRQVMQIPQSSKIVTPLQYPFSSPSPASHIPPQQDQTAKSPSPSSENRQYLTSMCWFVVEERRVGSRNREEGLEFQAAFLFLFLP
jgi:hypothetical protein